MVLPMMLQVTQTINKVNDCAGVGSENHDFAFTLFNSLLTQAVRCCCLHLAGCRTLHAHDDAADADAGDTNNQQGQ